MKVKKVTALLLVVMLIMQGGLAVEKAKSSAPKNVNVLVTPQWINTNEIRLDLRFAGGNAECTGRITGLTGTSGITATFLLERRNSNGAYSFVRSWSVSATGRHLTFFGTNPVSSGFTYRLSVIAEVTRNGFAETVSTSVETFY